MIFLWLLGSLVFVSFFLIVLRGAPWVPTFRRDIDELFLLHTFKKGDVLVDLGSGDGRVLRAAAERGVRSVGYELNPFLVWYSRFRLRQFRHIATVRLEDFWTINLPDDTAVVFVFLAKPFMKKLDAKLTDEAQRLGRSITLVSYGMEIPGKKPVKCRGGLLAYRYTAR
jgi:hypothetical protein